MNIERFEKMVRDPQRTRDELETLKQRALAQNQPGFARLVNDVLIERFPASTKQGGGATPTTAKYHSRNEPFDSGKAAYIWLVEQFCNHCPGALERFIALNTRRRSADKGSYFAKHPDQLFRTGSSLRGDPSNYVGLSSGWYASTTWNHDRKFAILMALSYVCGLEYEKDWDFRVTGATEELKGHQRAVISARKFVEELLGERGCSQDSSSLFVDRR